MLCPVSYMLHTSSVLKSCLDLKALSTLLKFFFFFLRFTLAEFWKIWFGAKFCFSNIFRYLYFKKQKYSIFYQNSMEVILLQLFSNLGLASVCKYPDEQAASLTNVAIKTVRCPKPHQLDCDYYRIITLRSETDKSPIRSVIFDCDPMLIHHHQNEEERLLALNRRQNGSKHLSDLKKLSVTRNLANRTEDRWCERMQTRFVFK